MPVYPVTVVVLADDPYEAVAYVNDNFNVEYGNVSDLPAIKIGEDEDWDRDR